MAFGKWASEKVGVIGWIAVIPIFFYFHVLEHDRIADYNEFIAREKNPPVTLFLTSYVDPLVPVEMVERMMGSRNSSRKNSAHVHIFEASPHLDHDILYPKMYREVLEDFLGIEWKTESPCEAEDREGACYRYLKKGKKEKKEKAEEKEEKEGKEVDEKVEGEGEKKDKKEVEDPVEEEGEGKKEEGEAIQVAGEEGKQEPEQKEEEVKGEVGEGKAQEAEQKEEEGKGDVGKTEVETKEEAREEKEEAREREEKAEAGDEKQDTENIRDEEEIKQEAK
jgi:hypothetical protein